MVINIMLVEIGIGLAKTLGMSLLIVLIYFGLKAHYRKGPIFTFPCPDAITLVRGVVLPIQTVQFPKIKPFGFRAELPASNSFEIGSVLKVSNFTDGWHEGEERNHLRIETELNGAVVHVFFFDLNKPISKRDEVTIRIVSFRKGEAYHHHYMIHEWFMLREFYDVEVVE